MNTKTALAIFSIVALLTAMTASSIVSMAFAEPPSDDGKKGGPKDEKNYGQCKQDFNENVCQRFT
jgi:uncharacterized membrane protein